jgi:hypothetical protein
VATRDHLTMEVRVGPTWLAYTCGALWVFGFTRAGDFLWRFAWIETSGPNGRRFRARARRP